MLDSLFAGALEDAKRREEQKSLQEIERIAQSQNAAIDARKHFSEAKNVSVIAEIKRASPSRGLMAEIPDASELALVYQDAGASAISVLTEERKFLGNLTDFDAVRERVSLPLLRKDFIASEYQVLEARAHGADIVLLIVAGIERELLKRLDQLIRDLGMTALIETHNRAEVEFAAEMGATFVGINARDLSTFETDRTLFAELSHILPDTAIKIAESAVRDAGDVRNYAAAGADAVLVGEALVTGDAVSLLRSFTQISKV